MLACPLSAIHQNVRGQCPRVRAFSHVWLAGLSSYDSSPASPAYPDEHAQPSSLPWPRYVNIVPQSGCSGAFCLLSLILPGGHWPGQHLLETATNNQHDNCHGNFPSSCRWELGVWTCGNAPIGGNSLVWTILSIRASHPWLGNLMKMMTKTKECVFLDQLTTIQLGGRDTCACFGQGYGILLVNILVCFGHK